MSCDAYEIGIRDYVEKKMMIRAWSPSKVIESVPWLKRMNLMCNDIFIKPAPGSETGIILIDDIDYDTVEQMKMDGYEPIVVVETSPKNYQAWIRLGKSVQEGVRTEAAILLAEEYGGDRNSAHALHFGRLAGFTNRKSEHTTARGQPWALLAYATDLKPNFVASSAEKLLGEAVMAHEDKERASNERMVQARASIPLPSEGYGSFAKWYKAFSSNARSPSEADWKLSVIALMNGYGIDIVRQLIMEHSAGLQDRKKGHVEDYLARTVGKAEIWVEMLASGAFVEYEKVKHKLLRLAQERAREREREGNRRQLTAE